jgi:serine/threonine protein kinase
MSAILGRGAAGEVHDVPDNPDIVVKDFISQAIYNYEKAAVKSLLAVSQTDEYAKHILRTYTLLPLNMADSDRWFLDIDDSVSDDEDEDRFFAGHIYYSKCHGKTLVDTLKAISEDVVERACLFKKTAIACLSLVSILQSRDMIHCDFKLDNLMYCMSTMSANKMGVKVIDFGSLGHTCTTGSPYYKPVMATSLLAGMTNGLNTGSIQMRLMHDAFGPNQRFHSYLEKISGLHADVMAMIDVDMYAIGMCLAQIFPYQNDAYNDVVMRLMFNNKAQKRDTVNSLLAYLDGLVIVIDRAGITSKVLKDSVKLPTLRLPNKVAPSYKVAYTGPIAVLSIQSFLQLHRRSDPHGTCTGIGCLPNGKKSHPDFLITTSAYDGVRELVAISHGVHGGRSYTKIHSTPVSARARNHVNRGRTTKSRSNMNTKPKATKKKQLKTNNTKTAATKPSTPRTRPASGKMRKAVAVAAA